MDLRSDDQEDIDDVNDDSSDHEIPDPTTNVAAMRDALIAADDQDISFPTTKPKAEQNQNQDQTEDQDQKREEKQDEKEMMDDDNNNNNHKTENNSDFDDDDKDLEETDVQIPCKIVHEIALAYDVSPDLEHLKEEDIPQEWIPVLKEFAKQSEIKLRRYEDCGSEATDDINNAAHDVIGQGIASHYLTCVSCTNSLLSK